MISLNREVEEISCFFLNFVVMTFQITAIVLIAVVNLSQSKVYDKCEIAQKFKENNGLSSENLAPFVCIAEHQSKFNTEAVGGNSEYFGLFQISSEYWCNTESSSGKACKVDCDKLIDDDLSDDFQCAQRIFEENGFKAWPSGDSCQSIKNNYLADCSTESSHILESKTSLPIKTKSARGKVYERCELARELRYQHNIPMNQIATWVCIAKHESNFNTSKLGRLNSDASEDHGIFHISDMYWCGNDGNDGKGCNTQCHEFRDSDISNDVSCVKKIYEEHERLHNDGFNAWEAYKSECKGKSEDFVKGCFEQTSNEILSFKPYPGIQINISFSISIQNEEISQPVILNLAVNTPLPITKQSTTIIESKTTTEKNYLDIASLRTTTKAQPSLKEVKEKNLVNENEKISIKFNEDIDDEQKLMTTIKHPTSSSLSAPHMMLENQERTTERIKKLTSKKSATVKSAFLKTQTAKPFDIFEFYLKNYPNRNY